MRKACGIITSSVTVAAMSRTWTGMTCRGLRQARSANGCFANANSFSGDCVPGVRRGALPDNDSNSKERIKHMEKQVTEAAVAGTHNDETVAGAAKCPVAHGARGRRNRDWWPDALDISVLHRNSSLSDPMGAGFDYGKEFESLDLDAVIKDLHVLMTDS